ncbi:MAG: GNAT family N-acetyltransferase [Chloroflexota bacterium]|nr:GNAT family N-acetyltransferase [Dehalococcoidia bacterium]MDW8046521.1 GNAT family N-acetyltransferase [Chloroflexota bacterium]
MAAASTVLLRFARPSDAEAIAAVVNQAYEVEAPFVGGPRTSPAAVQALAENGDFIVAEHDGRIVGTVFVELDEEPGIGRFGMLAVVPDEQARGLGRELVEAAEARLIRLGCGEARIRVLDQRDELLEWYRRLGYEPYAEEPYPFPERMRVPVRFVLMRKQLGG